ncbi:MAG: cytochrome c maturation protein CcmE [Acidimicrobiales bacterium]
MRSPVEPVEPGAPGAPGSLRPPPRHPWLGSRRRQGVAAVILAGALSFLVVQGLTNATVYFKTASQAVADRAQLGNRPFRIEGTVEHDVRQSGGTVRFDIFANNVTVAVVDTGQPPQLFQPGVPVVLEGHWQGAVYAADQIMVKHTAQYSEAHPNRLKPQLPPGSTR